MNSLRNVACFARGIAPCRCGGDHGSGTARHRRTIPSPPPEAKVLPSGEKRSTLTPRSCVRRVKSSTPFPCFRLRSRLHKLQIKTLLRVRQILSPEQRQKLKNLRHKRGKAFRAACSSDMKTLCADVSSRHMKKRCLFDNFNKLSPQCRKMVVKGFRHRHRGPGF